MGKLEGKNILIIGGNSGIGRACTEEFIKEGANILVAARSRSCSEIDAEKYISADMSDSQQIDELFEQVEKRMGYLDGFVYSAGMGSSSTFLNTTLEHFDQVLSVNLRGAFYSSKKAAMLMPNKGSIVFIASQKGLCGSTGSLAYNASKGGMIIMARSMAMELGEKKIRVNCVCPGPTETVMFAEDMNNQQDPEFARKKVAASNPLNLIADPEKIAAGVAYVLSDEASFMTGTELVLDGGNIAGVRNI